MSRMERLSGPQIRRGAIRWSPDLLPPSFRWSKVDLRISVQISVEVKAKIDKYLQLIRDDYLNVLKRHLSNLKYVQSLVQMLDRFPNFRLQIKDLKPEEFGRMLVYMNSSKNKKAREFRYEIEDRLKKVGKEHPVTLILGKRDSENDALIETLPRKESSVYIWRKW